jgi:tripartite-type tricarboxylate transporter receptor subunit TctC
MVDSSLWLSRVLTGTLIIFSSALMAQKFPSKPIRVIVPLAAGGPTDVLARGLAQKLSEDLGQSVIIDNRAGANTILGTEIVAKAAPDGYTLLLTVNGLTINPSLYGNIPYDPIRDFAPVSLIATSPLVLVIHPSLPVKSVQELIALVKSKAGQLLYGSPGSGSLPHLAGEMFNTMAGVKLVHVPYKAVTNAFSDLLGNHISLMFPGSPLALPQVNAGKLRALGTTGIKRLAMAPDMPTIAESGLPGYEASLWYGLLAPAGTPTPVTNLLHSKIVKLVDLPETQERWATLGAEPTHNTPEQFSAYLKVDLTKWTKVVRDSGAKLD